MARKIHVEEKLIQVEMLNSKAKIKSIFLSSIDVCATSLEYQLTTQVEFVLWCNVLQALAALNRTKAWWTWQYCHYYYAAPCFIIATACLASKHSVTYCQSLALLNQSNSKYIVDISEVASLRSVDDKHDIRCTVPKNKMFQKRPRNIWQSRITFV